jgi:DNA-binding CsgD family transcriptional regulator
VGLPLSVLLLAAVRSGQYDKAVRLLTVPVPPAMFKSTVGLHYLRARGRFHLSRRNYKAAVEDFKVCGEMMTRWGLDLPGMVPWRTDLAEAHLGLGLPARDLITAQLGLLSPRNRGGLNRRTRGITLRVLAATAERQQERCATLRDAVDELQAAGDQLELAETLNELSTVQRALGEYSKARMTSRRVQQLTTRCNIEPVVGAQASVDEEETPEPADDPMIHDLSDAERRVACLAAQGHTNQQIARKLFITVSTVEQHLTRVYRKLHINRRADLPFDLLANLRTA